MIEFRTIELMGGVPLWFGSLPSKARRECQRLVLQTRALWQTPVCWCFFGTLFGRFGRDLSVVNPQNWWDVVDVHFLFMVLVPMFQCVPVEIVEIAEICTLFVIWNCERFRNRFGFIDQTFISEFFRRIWFRKKRLDCFQVEFLELLSDKLSQARFRYESAGYEQCYNVKDVMTKLFFGWNQNTKKEEQNTFLKKLDVKLVEQSQEVNDISCFQRQWW